MFHFQESKEITWGAVEEEKAWVLCYRKDRDEIGLQHAYRYVQK